MKKSILAIALFTTLFSCKEESNDPNSNNKAPKITISEEDNLRTSAYYAGESRFYCMANASDEDGSIEKVIFYANSTPYDTIINEGEQEKSAPYFYAYPYSTNTSGTVKFTAKAFDDKGASTLSNEFSIVFESKPIIDTKPIDTKSIEVTEIIFK